MTAAICDDEKILCDQLEKWIKRQAPDCDLALFTSGEALLREKKDFDIIFLDIRMEGIDGIETAKRLRSRRAETILIFITGIKEHVFDAFDVSAFHYLLKPVDEEKFAEVFARAAAEVEKKKGREEAPLFLKSKGRARVLDRNEILYVESQNRMVHFHTAKEIVKIYYDLGKLEQQLGKNFYRCHRGYIVNLGYITEYGKDSITLTNGEVVYLSRRKYREFVKTYMDYLRNGGTLFDTLSSADGFTDSGGFF